MGGSISMKKIGGINMNFEETLNNLQEKIGKESAGLIADDIASLLSYENARNY